MRWQGVALLLLGRSVKCQGHEPKGPNVSSATIRLRDGSEMPALGLGTWKAVPGEVEEAVEAAILAGYRHIDAAYIYQNQQEVGAGLRRGLEKSGLQRKDVWVTSKIWLTDFELSRVGPALQTLLQELGLDYLDQVLLHWPIPLKAPPKGCPPECPEEFAGTDVALRPRGADGHFVQSDVPLVESWRALIKASDNGRLVRTLGVSNFEPADIEPLLMEEVVPVVNQVECHPNWRQDKLRRWLAQHKIALVAYSPLGNPSLYDRSALKSSLVVEIAKSIGRTPAQVLLRWSLQLGNIIIPKSANVGRIVENSQIFDFSLDEAQMATLNSLDQFRLANPPIRAKGRRAFDEL